MPSVDFEIRRADGSLKQRGVLPVCVMERVQPARRIETMGVVYDVPAMNVTQIMFGSSVTVSGDETLAIKLNHGELDGPKVGDGNGEPVSGDEDSALTIIPIRPDMRSDFQSPTVHIERPLRAVPESVHTSPDDDPSEGEARRGGY